MTDEEKILNFLYDCEADFMCWYPISATNMADFIDLSVYKIRKILHKLRDNGIVEFERRYVPDRISYEGELQEEGFFYCGWKLTKIGKDTDAYRKIEKEYEELVEKMF